MMQLQYKIHAPNYARNMLWLTGEGDLAKLDKQGTVDLPNQESPLTLRWGHPQGSPLAAWSKAPLTFTWEGLVHVWGHFNTAHLVTVADLDLMILELNGNVMPTAPRLPSLEQLRSGPHLSDNSIPAESQTAWYAFAVPLDSPLTDFAYQSLVNGNAIECYGALAEPNIGLHKVVGMPFVLESVTLYYAR